MSETPVKSSVEGVGILGTTRVKIAILVRMKPLWGEGEIRKAGEEEIGR